MKFLITRLFSKKFRAGFPVIVDKYRRYFNCLPVNQQIAIVSTAVWAKLKINNIIGAMSTIQFIDSVHCRPIVLCCVLFFTSRLLHGMLRASF